MMLASRPLRDVLFNLPLFHKADAEAAYRPELDPVAWDYYRGRITPAQLDVLCGNDVERKVAVVRFSPPPEWKGLDEHGNLILRKVWRRRTH